MICTLAKGAALTCSLNFLFQQADISTQLECTLDVPMFAQDTSAYTYAFNDALGVHTHVLICHVMEMSSGWGGFIGVHGNPI
jgi:hypothetical protein